MKGKWKWILALGLAFALTFSNLGSALAQPNNTMVQVLIGFTQSPTAAKEGAIKESGGIIKHRYHHIPVIVGQVPEKALPLLQDLRWVDYVELDGQVKAIAQNLPWGVDRIDADVVHPYNQGNGVDVAIIDTGIDLDHEDLNVAGDVTFVSRTVSGDDDNGHGTHCAGTVAALNNDIGVIGVAPQVELYAVKVLDRSGRGWLSDVIKGIEWAVEHNIDVINMSLGSSRHSYSLEQACKKAYEAGVLLVAATGNSGQRWSTSDSVIYPAKYESVIAVGATDTSDRRASWSSTGPAVELAAPGVNIYSTYYNNSYTRMSGTSMASPHVAGVAALIIASGITDDNGNGKISDEVRLRLQQTADDLGNPGRDREYGYGLVDADEAAPPGDNPPAVAITSPADGATVSGTITIEASASDDKGISKVDFYIDGTLLASDNTSPYACSWETTTKVDGSHNVTATARDTIGQSASDTIRITVDNTAPAQVSGLTVTTVSSSRLDLRWEANTELDLDHYNVYRSTTSGGPYDLVASPVSNSYSDTGLEASTSYYYIVSAIDVVGNEGTSSLEASGTTSEAIANAMHIDSIDMTLVQLYWGWRTYASAKVTIFDSSGNPVAGARVSGHWERATSDRDSGITDDSGKVTFYSNSLPRPPSGTTFTFVVDYVVKDAWLYDADANNESNDSVSV